LLAAGLSETESDTAVYIKNGRTSLRSSAVLHILKDLGGTWQILYVFIIVPPFIRDFFYRLIAHNRYRLFGKKESQCALPVDPRL
jgi:predicted DCC family thiol-disulfide oxidoreductase YuxK